MVKKVTAGEENALIEKKFLYFFRGQNGIKVHCTHISSYNDKLSEVVLKSDLKAFRCFSFDKYKIST